MNIARGLNPALIAWRCLTNTDHSQMCLKKKAQHGNGDWASDEGRSRKSWKQADFFPSEPEQMRVPHTSRGWGGNLISWDVMKQVMRMAGQRTWSSWKLSWQKQHVISGYRTLPELISGAGSTHWAQSNFSESSNEVFNWSTSLFLKRSTNLWISSRGSELQQSYDNPVQLFSENLIHYIGDVI